MARDRLRQPDNRVGGAYLYQCTRDEVEKVLAMKGKTVTFRCNIQSVTMSDSAIGTYLPIVIKTTTPSLDGFLPQYEAGGGSGFPGGTFTKEGTSGLTLRLEPGKATVFRGKVAEVTFRMATARDTVTIYKVPNNEDGVLRPWLSFWKYDKKRLMLPINGNPTKESALLDGAWRLKE